MRLGDRGAGHAPPGQDLSGERGRACRRGVVYERGVV